MRLRDGEKKLLKKRIILVDDVVTTGSLMGGAIMELRKRKYTVIGCVSIFYRGGVLIDRERFNLLGLLKLGRIGFLYCRILSLFQRLKLLYKANGQKIKIKI